MEENNELTLKSLKETKAGIFASGVMHDDPAGINMTNSGKLLRWVAVKGERGDWAVYCHFANRTKESIRLSGDKIISKHNVKRVVPCTDEAFELYRL